ncbi:uncharacterized protein [Scyliorhinus torazame]|uniref:uncharacterized protein n=1 Tax=Scyliorhinus torazame TaxID=75743 RepID=UPI003B5B7600
MTRIIWWMRMIIELGVLHVCHSAVIKGWCQHGPQDEWYKYNQSREEEKVKEITERLSRRWNCHWEVVSPGYMEGVLYRNRTIGARVEEGKGLQVKCICNGNGSAVGIQWQWFQDQFGMFAPSIGDVGVPYKGKISQQRNGKNGLILIQTLNWPQFWERHSGNVRCEPSDDTAYASSLVRLEAIRKPVKSAASSLAVPCPMLLPNPQTNGLEVLESGEFLYNDVRFEIVPVVLNLTTLHMPDGLCHSSYLNLFHLMLKEVVGDSQARNQRTDWQSPDPDMDEGLKTSRKRRGLAEWVGIGATAGVAGLNRIDVESMWEHDEVMRRQLKGLLTKLNDQSGDLIHEQGKTLLSTQEIATAMQSIASKVNEIIGEKNQEFAQQNISKAVTCSMYGNFVLTLLQKGLSDLESNRIPAFVKNHHLAMWLGANKTEEEYKRIRRHGLAFFAPRAHSQGTDGQVPVILAVPIVVSSAALPVRLYKVESIGVIELSNDNAIFKEFRDHPRWLINKKGTWLAPDLECCRQVGNEWVCRCDVYQHTTPACGFTLDEHSPNCTVSLSQWSPGQARTAYVGRGKYCVTTSASHLHHGETLCPINTPMFCLSPVEPVKVGGKMLLPVHLHNVTEIQLELPLQEEALKSVVHFGHPIPPLSISLKSILQRTATSQEHLVRMQQDNKDIEKGIKTLGDHKWWDVVYNVGQSVWARMASYAFLIVQFVLTITVIITLIRLRSICQRLENQLHDRQALPVYMGLLEGPRESV